MVYELGHVGDRYTNTNNNIGRCGSNYVNKFIGNIAKDYMETTEGENWASNLISHLNSRFPTSIDNPKNFIQQEVQDANLHQIISSHSSLPDLLVSNSFFPPENDMNSGYSRYSPASVNIYNPILCGGSAYNEYAQNVAYGAKQSDLDIITSPEQASTITASSYGDIISDTEVFDSLTAISSFQQPFNNSQYISPQSFRNLPEASDAYGFEVLSAYVMYKDMPENLRKEVSFQDYMHAAECQGKLCKCHLHVELASHFDRCHDLECSVCGPARRSLCGGTGGFQLESRKRKLDQSEAIDNTGPTSSGTLLDVPPTKCPKLESSTVDEGAMNDRQQSTVVDRSDNIVNDEILKNPKLNSSSVGEEAVDVDQRREVNGVHDQQESIVVKSNSSTIGEDAIGEELESMVVNQTHNIANNLMLKYPILESSIVGEDDLDDNQRRKVNRARDQKKSTVVKQSGNIVNNEKMSSPKLSSDYLSSKDIEAIVDANNDSNSGADVADLDSDKVDCDNARMKSPQLCSDHDQLSSKETIIDEKEKSGEAVKEANADSTSGADVADLTSMTPDVSMVDCDSVLESDQTKIKLTSLTVNEMTKSPLVFSDLHSSKETIIDEKEKSGADVADLNSNKSKIKAASLTDNDSQLEPEKVKIQSVSLADFFTADQIKEHLSSFTSQKASSENRAPSIGPNTCQLCSNDKLVFAPTPIYCSSCDTRIKRNVGYYRTTTEIGARHCFCIPCYRGTHGNNILMRGYGYSMPKSNLQRARNDEEKEDSWVLCDKCQNWQHRICGLYNDEKDVEGKAEYICPKCYLQELESGIRVPLPQSTASGAKDLPRTNLSDHIEQRLFERLNQERQEMAKLSGIKPSEVPMAEGLVVRVVVSVEKQVEVRQKFRSILNGEYYPSGFTYRSKLIFLFQKIEGVDVCLFGMCVQEFGSECGGPNNRCVYISYLDSVKYFRPERKCVTGESLRTFIYHEILIGYLDYCKKRGFATCYIWACPLVKGEDYIFYCHPETQRTPKQDKLRQWYKSMLKKATEANVVIDHTNLYNQFFLPGGEGNNMKITAARLPYFDGDYWSVAAENHARKLELEETAAGGLLSKLPNKRMLKAMGQDKPDIAVKDVLVMQKLGQTILTVKENFMIVHLQHICTRCREVILSGSRWFCSRCNKIQLCSRCFNADKNISESKLHTCHSGEKNQLSEVVVNDVAIDTKDTDDVFVNSFFETRDAFLNKCQKSHFQFDTLSRAKYSSMMILYHLIYKPVIKPTCTTCHSDVIVEQCFYCDTCPKFYICESCYRLRHGAYHPHRLYPPSLDIDCGSKITQLQMQRDWQYKIVLNTLMHASDCDRIPCAYKECNTIRRLFSHAVRCGVKPRRDCKFCRRVWSILRLHSQTCADSECKIPRCMDIKKHKGMLASEHIVG